MHKCIWWTNQINCISIIKPCVLFVTIIWVILAYFSAYLYAFWISAYISSLISPRIPKESRRGIMIVRGVGLLVCLFVCYNIFSTPMISQNVWRYEILITTKRFHLGVKKNSGKTFFLARRPLVELFPSRKQRVFWSIWYGHKIVTLISIIAFLVVLMT